MQKYCKSKSGYFYNANHSPFKSTDEKENPNSNEEAMATLSIVVKSMNPDLVGRLFSAKIIELSLANYPGFFSGGGGKKPGPVIVYWPALVDSKYIKEYVHLDGVTTEIIPTSKMGFKDDFYPVSYTHLRAHET